MDSFRILGDHHLKQPRKNPSHRRRLSRPDKWLSRTWKRSFARTLLLCSRGSACCPTQSPLSRSTRGVPLKFGPKLLNRSYRVLSRHTHRTRPRSLYVSSISEREKKFGTKRNFSANGTTRWRYGLLKFGWGGWIGSFRGPRAGWKESRKMPHMRWNDYGTLSSVV